MKRFTKLFGVLLLSSLSLTSCSFLKDIIPSGDNSGESGSKEGEITDFEFVQDDKLVWTEESYGSFYKLTLVSGETYQVRTNIDNQLGSEYELRYTAADDAEGFTISSTGLVTSESGLESTKVSSFTVGLYKTGSDRRISSHYVITNIYREGYEYATVSLNDATLPYDSSSKTYTLALAAGDTYHIALNTTANVELTKNYSLMNSSDSSFMEVSSSGVITTSSDVEENKGGKVLVTVRSANTNALLDYLYIQVNITANPTPTDTLVVTNSVTGDSVTDGCTINLPVYESLILSVKYNNSLKYNVVSSDSALIEIEGSTNTITALATGDASVTVSYLAKSITFTVHVIGNALDHIYDPNEGQDFVILNGTLYMLGHIKAVYESGYEEDVTESSALTYQIAAYSATHKSVTFTYTKSGVNKSVTYQVRFFTPETYTPEDTAFDFNSYGRESYYGDIHYLSNSGNLKLLVIPVWFSNSTDFFTVDQKAQIKEDIAEKVLSEDDSNCLASLKKFYETESRGTLNITATITDYYLPGDSSTSYPDSDEPTKTYNLAHAATQWYFNTNSEDSISNYDADSDGKVDGVIIMYGAYYYGLKSATPRTTAYAWPNTDNERNYNTGCFVPIGSMYGLSRSTSEDIVKSKEDLSTYYAAQFRRGSKTINHEVGHMFGAIDLYEYAPSGEQKNYPCGSFSMQDNDAGGHEPYHTNLIGWTKPDIYESDDYSVGQKVTISIDDFQSSGNNIVLTKKWNEYNSLFDEYLILELYTPTGLNKYDSSIYHLTSPGLRVWHVNSVLEEYTRSTEDEPYLTPNVFENGQSVIKYSTNDRTSEYDAVHLIRNSEEVGIDVTSTISSSDLFKEGDDFVFTDFSKQFVNSDRLDNEEKLGWSFSVEKIIEKENDVYTAVITLEKVDSTKTQFRAKAKMSNTYDEPVGDTTEYGETIFNDENISLIYKFNDSAIYTGSTELPKKAMSSEGIQLFGEANGNGGSIVLSVKSKAGFTVRLLNVKFSHSPSNGVVKVFDDGDELSISDTFVGPVNSHFSGEVHDSGKIYDLKSINISSVEIKNCFSGTVNHWSSTIMSTLVVEYELIAIS